MLNEITKKNNKVYDLEERTFLFAQAVRKFIKKLPKTVSNYEDSKQLARASASVGANYIEANENLGTKDFNLHIKISKKESKESRFFLRLIDCNEEKAMEEERKELVQEATELMLIFGAILKSKQQ